MSNRTPYMDLDLPVPGETPAGEWGDRVNSAIEGIDEHNHTPGSGKPIPPDGLDMNTDLSLKTNALTDVGTIRFTAKAAPSQHPGALHRVGADLYFVDGSGNPIRMTKDGQPAVAPSGSIEDMGEPALVRYDSNEQVYQFIADSNQDLPGGIESGSILIREQVAGGKGYRLTAPSGLADDHDIHLPALPSQKMPLVLSPTGGVTTEQIALHQMGAGAVGTDQLVNGAVTQQKRAALPYQASATLDAFTTSSTSFVAVSDLTATLNTSGRPVLVSLVPAPAQTAYVWGADVDIALYVDGAFHSAVNQKAAVNQGAIGSLSFFVTPAAGNRTFSIRMKTGGSLGVLSGFRLVAIEL